jgi:hypothetical protein
MSSLHCASNSAGITSVPAGCAPGYRTRGQTGSCISEFRERAIAECVDIGFDEDRAPPSV